MNLIAFFSSFFSFICLFKVPTAPLPPSPLPAAALPPALLPPQVLSSLRLHPQGWVALSRYRKEGMVHWYSRFSIEGTWRTVVKKEVAVP